MRTAKAQGIEVAVCGWRELGGWSTAGITHILTIWGGADSDAPRGIHQIRGTFPAAEVFPIYFDDVIEPDVHCPPTTEVIRDVLGLTSRLVPGNRLLVQCTAGISRSSAIAYAALCQHWGPGLEIECFVELKWARPQAAPNRLVVQLADGLLSRGGEMLRAIE